MNNTCEGLTSRPSTLADGRYLIFYDFVTSPTPIPSQPPPAETQPEAELQIEEN
jgi:hypothetical protein